MARVVAGIAVGLGVLIFLAYLHLLGRGPFASAEMRHLRAMKDRTASPQRIEPITLAEILALPRNLTVAEYSGYERRAVSFEGRVHAMFRATDGDFHLEVAADAPAPSGSDAPREAGKAVPWITAEVTPAWHGASSRRRGDGWSFERLLTVFRPDVGGAREWDGGPARVRLSGWLLYDGASDVALRLLHLPPLPRATDWEIHPVTRIERWDAAAGDWIEVKR